MSTAGYGRAEPVKTVQEVVDFPRVVRRKRNNRDATRRDGKQRLLLVRVVAWCWWHTAADHDGNTFAHNMHGTTHAPCTNMHRHAGATKNNNPIHQITKTSRAQTKMRKCTPTPPTRQWHKATYHITEARVRILGLHLRAERLGVKEEG